MTKPTFSTITNADWAHALRVARRSPNRIHEKIRAKMGSNFHPSQTITNDTPPMSNAAAPTSEITDTDRFNFLFPPSGPGNFKTSDYALYPPDAMCLTWTVWSRSQNRTFCHGRDAREAVDIAIKFAGGVL